MNFHLEYTALHLKTCLQLRSIQGFHHDMVHTKLKLGNMTYIYHTLSLNENTVHSILGLPYYNTGSVHINMYTRPGNEFLQQSITIATTECETHSTAVDCEGEQLTDSTK